MANVWAIHSVGDSLVEYLRDSYEPFSQANESGPNAVPDCTFKLLSSLALDDMESADDDNQLSIYLYRVNINEHLRNSRQANGSSQQKEPLSLDLHFLMTAWSKNAMAEQLILAWAMRQLHDHPLLDRSYLSAQANWNREDVVQIIPAELTHEDMMRIWDTLKPAYRLSFGYVARVVRIESEQVGSDLPVVATRMVWGELAENEPVERAS
ncbi:DUF4255 domain-containing protein [cf. Phormidesmis sp. LEGE 11477]|uniref:DUF4255 domain-containing protein n=1 Tax=cf. Phormidesmis sp. LEGE 11477 TaxID=1828680 RepID=UPI0018818499|nr:DUF4255 domain-containing protein [cf. Phormidesmis sp. LEGE 11477]MBE9064691.1 DUF4255 domain-containing protein [cf. Phormidesmis sp. LEGE 11477]